ncbi:MAG: hypothetical protein WCJ87_02980 [Burkholderiales bacterium]
MSEKKNRGGAREGAGRKPTPEADALKVGSIRLTLAQWEKLARLGGVAWLRTRIDKARTPEET